MATRVSKNPVKVSVFIDKQGNKIEMKGKDRFKQMQEVRAKKLGLK